MSTSGRCGRRTSFACSMRSGRRGMNGNGDGLRWMLETLAKRRVTMEMKLKTFAKYREKNKARRCKTCNLPSLDRQEIDAYIRDGGSISAVLEWLKASDNESGITYWNLYEHKRSEHHTKNVRK